MGCCVLSAPACPTALVREFTLNTHSTTGKGQKKSVILHRQASLSQFKMHLNIYYHECCVFWHIFWQTAKLRRTIQTSAGYSHNAMCDWFLQGHVFWGNVLGRQGNGFLTRWSTYLKVKTKTMEGTYFRYVPIDFTYQMEKCVCLLNCMPTKLSVTSSFCPQEESPQARNFQILYNKPIQIRFSIYIILYIYLVNTDEIQHNNTKKTQAPSLSISLTQLSECKGAY